MVSKLDRGPCVNEDFGPYSGELWDPTLAREGNEVFFDLSLGDAF